MSKGSRFITEKSAALVSRSQLVEPITLTRFMPDGGTLFWDSAEEYRVTDVDGNEFVDLTSSFGACLLGYSHPMVKSAVIEQLEKTHHVMGEIFPTPLRVEASELILDALALSAEEWCVTFAVSGSDAVDLSLKTAILATGNQHFLSFSRGFHGQSLGALTVTAHEDLVGPFRPLVGRSSWLPFPENEDEVASVLQAVRRELERQTDTGSEQYAAIIYEPVLGAGGYLPAPDSFQMALSEICLEFEIPLIADEIFCGSMRCGHFSVSLQSGAKPGIICLGKAIANGFPIAVTVMRKELAKKLDSTSLIPLHGSTFAANPLALSALIATVSELRKDHTVQKLTTLTSHVEAHLLKLEQKHDGLISTRSRGLMIGLEIGDRSPSDLKRTSSVIRSIREEGFISIQTGLPYANVLGLSPPLLVPLEEFDRFFSALDHILSTLSV